MFGCDRAGTGAGADRFNLLRIDPDACAHRQQQGRGDAHRPGANPGEADATCHGGNRIFRARRLPLVDHALHKRFAPAAFAQHRIVGFEHRQPARLRVPQGFRLGIRCQQRLELPAIFRTERAVAGIVPKFS
ncbi:MAG: hypothetical protein WD768_19375 [Phycisphaeraceae bacterium]